MQIFLLNIYLLILFDFFIRTQKVESGLLKTLIHKLLFIFLYHSILLLDEKESTNYIVESTLFVMQIFANS